MKQFARYHNSYVRASLNQAAMRLYPCSNPILSNTQSNRRLTLHTPCKSLTTKCTRFVVVRRTWGKLFSTVDQIVPGVVRNNAGVTQQSTGAESSLQFLGTCAQVRAVAADRQATGSGVAHRLQWTQFLQESARRTEKLKQKQRNYL